MGVEENKKLVVGFIENMSSGNAAAAFAALADSATWWVARNFALSGTKTKAQFAELGGALASKIDGSLRLTAKGVTAEGERVAVEAEIVCQDEKRQEPYQNLYDFLFVVRDGKIQSVKEYLDTMHAADVLCS